MAAFLQADRAGCLWILPLLVSAHPAIGEHWNEHGMPASISEAEHFSSIDLQYEETQLTCSLGKRDGACNVPHKSRSASHCTHLSMLPGYFMSIARNQEEANAACMRISATVSGPFRCHIP